MPTPCARTHSREHTCSCEVPMDRFAVNHGYRERSSVQLRLNDDGTVYMCDEEESRYPKYISAKVPFEVFVAEWPRFIQLVAAKAYAESDSTPPVEPGEQT